MYKDYAGNELNEGDFVRILKVEPHWFEYCPDEAYQILQKACFLPLKIDYFDDNDRLSLILPPTKDFDDDYVSNSITLKCVEVAKIS